MVETWDGNVPKEKPKDDQKGCLSRTAAAGVATLALLAAHAALPPNAGAHHTRNENAWNSVANLVVSDACSSGKLTGNRIALAPGGASWKYGHGYFVPSGYKGRIYIGGRWKYTFIGPYTRCNAGESVSVLLLRV